MADHTTETALLVRISDLERAAARASELAGRLEATAQALIAATAPLRELELGSAAAEAAAAALAHWGTLLTDEAALVQGVSRALTAAAESYRATETTVATSLSSQDPT